LAELNSDHEFTNDDICEFTTLRKTPTNQLQQFAGIPVGKCARRGT
jgi:hypothetical protein